MCTFTRSYALNKLDKFDGTDGNGQKIPSETKLGTCTRKKRKKKALPLLAYVGSTFDHGRN